VSGEEIVYLRDGRTNLRFAALGLQNPAGTSISALAMTNAPCVLTIIWKRTFLDRVGILA
jgi:hypothetical protein